MSPKYLIREVCTYELEAPDAATALDAVINTKDGMVKHFTGVEEREMFEDGKPIEEPEINA